MKKRLINVIITILFLIALIFCANTFPKNIQYSPDSENSDQASVADSEMSLKDTAPDSENSGKGSALNDDNLITPQYKISYPETAENYGIYIYPVPSADSDFIRGVDVSEVLVEENSGVIYKDEYGNEKDVFLILAEAGVNTARIRIWNDPFDKNGNPYGGGNNDLKSAIILGKRATEYGMNVLIDFHYSDFWADPNRQLSPKEWAHLRKSDKLIALHDFTYDCLDTLLSEGVNVTMVQVGNETNYAMAGESDESEVHKLMNEGSKAVREISAKADKDIKVVLHYTNSSNIEEHEYILNSLQKDNVDFDIIGLSFYPFWDGDFDKVATVMKNIKAAGKDVFIAETSYPFTLEDGDGHPNSAAEADLVEGYAATVQSQASMLNKVCELSANNDGMGIFYWGTTWVPVPSANPDDPEAGKETWEKYGSGWASSYAEKYDPENVGKWYGGSAWDNMALFDFDGKALPSLSTFKYLQNGTICESKIDFVPNVTIECNVGEELVIPDKIPAIYNNRQDNSEIDVTWDKTEIDTSKDGEYVISGVTSSGHSVTATITVAAINYVVNESFEDNDRSMWTVKSDTANNPTDFQKKEADAYEGEYAFHYYDEENLSFCIEQTIENLEPGNYKASVCSQGGDFSSDDVLELYVIADGEEYTEKFMNDGWVNWQTPVIDNIKVSGTATIGVRIASSPKSWGTLDNFSFTKISQ